MISSSSLRFGLATMMLMMMQKKTMRPAEQPMMALSCLLSIILSLLGSSGVLILLQRLLFESRLRTIGLVIRYRVSFELGISCS